MSDIRNTHIQERLKENATCNFPTFYKSPLFLFSVMHLEFTWKATQTAYILAAVQVKEAVRAQMEDRVVSP